MYLFPIRCHNPNIALGNGLPIDAEIKELFNIKNYSVDFFLVENTGVLLLPNANAVNRMKDNWKLFVGKLLPV